VPDSVDYSAECNMAKHHYDRRKTFIACVSVTCETDNCNETKTDIQTQLL